jgi:hypothetical protein
LTMANRPLLTKLIISINPYSKRATRANTSVVRVNL